MASKKSQPKNPYKRIVVTDQGVRPPQSHQERVVVSRLAQYQSAIERGMTPKEAEAFVASLRERPNRPRGLPNVPIPNSRERKNGVTIEKKRSQIARAKELKAAEAWAQQIRETHSRVKQALLQAGHKPGDPHFTAAKGLVKGPNQRVRELRRRKR